MNWSNLLTTNYAICILVILATCILLATSTYAYEPPTEKYCYDNDTLVKIWEWNYDGTDHNHTLNESCDYGCDKVTEICFPAPFERYMGIGIGVALIFVIAGVIYSKGGKG